MSTLYGILGINQSASDDDIRKAYKKKALETHPDRIGPNASEIRREIALARFQKEYDATLSKPTAVHGRQAELRENEEQLNRMRDRMEWAQQQRKREEERIAVIRAKDKELKERKEKEAKMAKEFVQELFSLNPEWEERRRRVHQQREQRQKSDVKRADPRPVVK
ncbi:DnaJ-domain-containing protein [Amanita rubescens]|nr:DnaJ-domain-containing protein [Amanita rubescens]